LTKDGSSFQDLVDEEFRPIVDKQLLGKSSIPDVPVLVNHSRLDDVVPFEQGRDLASTWCTAGNRAAFEGTVETTHVVGYVVWLLRVEAFTDRTFAGKAPLDSCWRL